MDKVCFNVLLWLTFNFVYTDALVQDFCWRDYIPGYIPPDALKVEEGKFIGQIIHNGLQPATIYPHRNEAAFEHGDKIIVTDNIKIFCTNSAERFYWEEVDFSKPPGAQMQNTVKGGYQIDAKHNLYIGKVFEGGEWKIGKVVDADHGGKGLWTWDKDNKTLRLNKFQVLKYNFTTALDYYL